ncbi:sialidase family protein [Sinomonas sp. ASV322]|uniref:sialidase family protein n=1 Tax=Sinomonas sp. ASV322 TaxID=3041920 RepID=UPI0027DD99AD|nr:sialidase family protein [Sinomonas sp. ASV322]MDQ4504155.1 sialidase family protein [Sinomonas sp. ASV322]
MSIRPSLGRSLAVVLALTGPRTPRSGRLSLRSRSVVALAAASAIALAAAPAVSSAPISSPTTGDAIVTSGSPAVPFPQNKQNEPSIARDPISGTLIAGVNDEIDLAPCVQRASGAGSCPFTPGVGLSGVYFSTDNGASWKQPTYAGFSARSGTGKAGGPIGTLPNFAEAGLVSGGDPIVSVGPRPDAQGHFSWSNGSRYYYSNLTGNFPGTSTLVTPNFAVAVSHTDDVKGAVAGHNAAWSAPSIASGRLNPVLFDDKSSMWTDNAASSPFFGRVYVSWTAFRAANNTHTPSEPEPILAAFSDDGGDTWSQPAQVSPAHDSAHNGGRQGSTIRTDSKGNVFLFFEGTVGTQSVQMMAVSDNGGRQFSTPRPVADVADVGVLDAFANRFTFDGFAGARTNSFPSVDIANGAPSGQGASDRILLGWSDARNGLGHEEALLQTSADGGASWSTPVSVQARGDRPDFTAVAISPDGRTAYAVYDAFHAVYTDLSAPRPMEGVVVALNGDLSGPVSMLHRGVSGDARAASSNSLVSEFIGDYNSAVASNTAVYPVWNDVRNGDNCNAVDAYRTALRTPSGSAANASSGTDWGEDSSTAASTDTTPPRPFPPAACGAGSRFGNSDIYSGVFSR